MQLLITFLAILLIPSLSFRVSHFSSLRNFNGLSYQKKFQLQHSIPEFEIISPFDPSRSQDLEDNKSEGPLSLTEENVQKVLNEVRPFLQGDGGDVKLTKIDGSVVQIELSGSCLSCSSSSITLKLGIEKKMRERIPAVTQVIQMMPDAPDITEENVEEVLAAVRPFLSIAGGDVNVKKIVKMSKGFPTVITLQMEGSAKALFTVRIEIVERIESFFKQPLNIQWED